MLRQRKQRWHYSDMSSKFKAGDHVLVPAGRLAEPDQQPYALMPRKVLAQSGRSVRVDDGAGGTVEIASRLVHPSSLGFLVLRIGDFGTEVALLDPLAKSVLHFLRLLIPDSDLRAIELRTLARLDVHWAAHYGATSHVILIGHGSSSNIRFVGDGPVSGTDLALRLHVHAPNSQPKTFISLACLTGRAAFAKGFSLSPICRDLIAPFRSVHGAAASQFCQTLLTDHLLGGVEIPYAYAHSAGAVVEGGRFRRWRDGSMS